MFDLSILLIYILLSPVIGALVLLLISPTKNKKLKWLVMFWFSQPVIGSSILLWGLFNSTWNFYGVGFATEEFSWLKATINFGVDTSSCSFLIAGTVLVPLCVLASWEYLTSHLKEFLIVFLLLETLLLSYISIVDIILFYDIFGYSKMITHSFDWSIVIYFIVR